MAIGSFLAGLSRMSANSVSLNVIGNNLANINTIGFKTGAVAFEDVVSQAVGGSTNDLRQVGLGVNTGSIAPHETSARPIPNYLGFGQNVPDDLQRATPPVLADWVPGEAIGAHA
jgi:Flagella basal body rod protein